MGLGRYCRSLIDGLGRVDRENQYKILIPENSYLFKEWPNFQYCLVRLPVFKRRFWEQVAPLVVGPYDLLHFPYDSCVAIKRGKFVVTIHDIKPQLFQRPRIKLEWKSLIKKVMIPNPVQQIDHVVTVSESSRRDIVLQLGVPDTRITVVYQGVELERFHPYKGFPAEPKINQPYVLCVAGADPTKNVKTLITLLDIKPIGLLFPIKPNKLSCVLL